MGNCTGIWEDHSLNEMGRFVWKAEWTLAGPHKHQVTWHTNFLCTTWANVMLCSFLNCAHVAIIKCQIIWQSFVLLMFIYRAQITAYAVSDPLQHLPFKVVFSTLGFCVLISFCMAYDGCYLMFCIALSSSTLNLRP